MSLQVRAEAELELRRRAALVEPPPPIVSWAESEFYVRDEETLRYGPIRLFPWQARILHDCLTPDPGGRLPWQTIIYSCPKKGGKSTIAALAMAWIGTQFVPASGEVYFLANTREQAKARVFKFVRRALLHNPRLSKMIDHDRGTRNRIILTNETEFIPIAAEAATAAGGNQDAVSYDELWGFVGESAGEAYEEMTPPPTRPNCIQFISTYAGYEDQPGLLRPLYDAGQQGDRWYADGYSVADIGGYAPPTGYEPDSDGWYDDPLPVYVREDLGLYMYWDSGIQARRMPWQNEDYYAQERNKVRDGEMSQATFNRLHLNRWGASESLFVIDADLWRACQMKVAK